MPLPDETEVTEQTRIQQLIRDELVKIARDLTGWRVLYRDPKDGRLWQLSYPQSEMHGGGPGQAHLDILSSRQDGLRSDRGSIKRRQGALTSRLVRRDKPARRREWKSLTSKE